MDTFRIFLISLRGVGVSVWISRIFLPCLFACIGQEVLELSDTGSRFYLQPLCGGVHLIMTLRCMVHVDLVHTHLNNVQGGATPILEGAFVHATRGEFFPGTFQGMSFWEVDARQLVCPLQSILLSLGSSNSITIQVGLLSTWITDLI